ncbi:hypothetical protein CN386_01170 [Bacillus cereus]|nr:hypothetical protein CN386_01170 [Bacillus cereus]PGT80197.1 hypothetical protein COD14_01075 [Bacillus cereus]PGV95195.1 hypothetical protein COD86_13635 [Bacillus cereus]
MFKAEVTCSEQEGIGAPDVEALFASQEKAKPPNILATGAGYQFKAEAARSESLFSMRGLHMLIHEIISTIFSLYRRFDTGYRLTDKSRQYQRPSPLLLSIYYNPFYVKI